MAGEVYSLFEKIIDTGKLLFEKELCEEEGGNLDGHWTTKRVLSFYDIGENISVLKIYNEQGGSSRHYGKPTETIENKWSDYYVLEGNEMVADLERVRDIVGERTGYQNALSKLELRRFDGCFGVPGSQDSITVGFNFSDDTDVREIDFRIEQ